jgi:hypothetical protein
MKAVYWAFHWGRVLPGGQWDFEEEGLCQTNPQPVS